MSTKVSRRVRRWLLSTLEGAGFAKWGIAGLVARWLAAVAVVGALVFINSRLFTFSACLALLAGALFIEMLSGRAATRRREIAKLWPEVLDSLASAEVAGIGLTEAFADLAEHAPAQLRDSFVRANARLGLGFTLDEVLVALKAEFGSVHSDRLVELLRMVNQNGARGYHALLRDQSKVLRADLAMWSSIETKQSWVLGTAKLAIAAPWMIVALLATRAENASVYNSPGGTSLLLTGLLVSGFAYYLIHLLGALPQPRRVLQ